VTRASYRGQPLVALLLILGGWVAMRVMVWDAAAAMADASTPFSAQVVTAGEPPAIAAAVAPAPSLSTEATPFAKDASDPAAPARPLAGMQAHRAKAPSPQRRTRYSPPPAAPSPVEQAQATAEDRILSMAALTRLPLPARLVAALAPHGAETPASPAAHRDPRWSGDAWLLLRRGGNVSTVSGFLPATYGASQAGAVLRYRLAPTSEHRPSLYLRGSAALNGSNEREAALGLSARPLAHVPLVLAAEARINSQPGATRLRPAAFAYTELPPFALPYGALAELYAQAGYVGGNFASAFVDGQLRLDRRFARVGDGELRVGGGLWGGAQKGASRLDVGPAVTLGIPLGGAAGARLEADWRFRAAGNAAPASGPALTLSAGF
jgi:hypothetical protein